MLLCTIESHARPPLYLYLSMYVVGEKAHKRTIVRVIVCIRYVAREETRVQRAHGVRISAHSGCADLKPGPDLSRLALEPHVEFHPREPAVAAGRDVEPAPPGTE